ncbi:Protein of unknown function DUF3661, vaculolar transmembrane [Lasallia pustulata]|uniref:Vacuolar membrane protein n=1 Tax=Lasallia pustulata TaxID=136370 RepID=A0A1W5DD96_9LECA|nr:Protein of unknown function DUF3661, vaculolar transmembrane [Lasallia pustulata]
MFSSGQIVSAATIAGYQANPCSFYLLNLAIDTTIGIPILIVLLRLLTHAFSLTPIGNPPESIHSGNYGHPPRATWWLKQSLIYFIGLLGMKICVFFIFQICPWIVRVGDWSLRWTEGNEAIQVVFVMLLFPVIMNAIQYYIIDSFIKDQKPTDHEPIPSEGDEDEDVDQGLDGAFDSEDEAGIAKNVETTEDSGTENKDSAFVSSKKLRDYDPDKDGDARTSIAGSGSGSTSSGDDGKDADKQAARRAT